MNETNAFVSGEVADRLAARFGDDWDFDVRLHNLAGGDLVVEGELRANDRKISHSITVADHPDLAALPLGDRIESASARSLELCSPTTRPALRDRPTRRTG